MKKPKMYTGLISNIKNNKSNIIGNQIKPLNKQPTKTKNTSFRQILLKFKTQKSSPHKIHKTPPKKDTNISS